MKKIQDIVLSIRTEYALWKAYRKQETKNKNRKVRFYNWWGDDYEQEWLYRFIVNTGLMAEKKRTVNFCSVFGKREILKYVNDGTKVFFTGENLELPDHAEYRDGLLGDKDCTLSLGFENKDDERYMRFPLWLTYVFEPTTDEQKIRERCKKLRYPEIGERKKFAALVSRYDWSGTRSQIYDAIKHIAPIGCPSAVLHNDEELKTKYKDNKLAYIKQFAFNICPENSNADGYVTEKVFEAIAAGCIPIYWGSNNKPESGILNQNAIIRWNMNGDNTEYVHLIEDLWTNPIRLEEFFYQPRLAEGAEDEVTRMMKKLYERLKELV